MLGRLVSQFGMKPQDLIAPGEARIHELVNRQFDVFYIPEALASPFVPSQDSFVAPYGVRTVLGFGAILPAGAVFAVILFLRVAIPSDIAKMFQPLALSVKVAMLEASRGVETSDALEAARAR